MKRFVMLLLVMACCSGCVTSQTLQTARGETKVVDGKKVVTVKPQPAAYAFIPVAVVADTVTLPFWVVVTIGVNLGLMEAPF